MIKKKYSFDEVFDTQKLFRLVLDGMANPFRRKDIAKICEGFEGAEFPAALALGELFLDPEVSFSVPGEVQLEEELHSLTGALISEPKEADYLFVIKSSDLSVESLSQLKHGTLDEPEKSCTLIVLLEAGDCLRIRPEGPGIKEGSEFDLETEALDLMRKNHQLNIPFPCGKDFIFISSTHELYCWPRTSHVKEVEEWHM